MTLSKITREAVLAAITEYNQKGSEAFLAEYGFQEARQYFLVFQGKEYPSKAILGVAHKYVDPNKKPLAASDFSGGKDTVEKKLKDLGFVVRSSNISYWWVNHSQTHKAEIDGGYIWSPKENKGGARNQTYINLTKTNPGDRVISYADTMIRAIGVVTAPHREQEKPSEYGKAGDLWDKRGWLVPIEWVILDKPISPKHYLNQIVPLLPILHKPIKENGNGNQNCYLASISNDLGELIIELTKEKGLPTAEILDDLKSEAQADQQEEQIRSQPIDETEKDQLIKARKGQGKFRLNLESIEHRCRLTHLSNKNFLIASHIKPWKDCNNFERLDGNNGLLLSPHVDKLFDKGWISFTDEGNILCANESVSVVMNAWGLDPAMNVGSFSSSQRKYLKYHRESVFKHE